MVVKEDGTKWACQSCLKGHRVSGCTHTDRELTLVPKKGRPVTQCQHCRLERKKRSAHVKCECGEGEKPHHPKEKCIHLREADERAKAGYHDEYHADRDPSHLASVAEEQGCCCHHGGKCTCAFLKRDPADDVAAPHGPAVKPRLEKTPSDGAVTVFANGHHKPVHRKNHAAHECGMPYKIPMPRSTTDSSITSATRRSFDTLGLEGGVVQASPSTPTYPIPFSTERRKSKSEQPSPILQPISASYSSLGDARLGSRDYGLAPSRTNSSVHSYTTENFASPLEAMSGATDSSFDPWSTLPLAEANMMPNNNPFGVWPTQHDNNSLSQPALTAASSGTQSEIDEVPPIDDAYYFMPSIQEDANSDTVDFIPDTSSQTNRRSLPPGFFGNTDFEVGGLSNTWQTALNNFNMSEQDKGALNSESESVADTWQMPTSAPLVCVPQRALGGVQYASRPQSRSVGSTSAPNDEIIKQLFPDLELNDGYFGAAASPMNPDGMNGMTAASKSGVVSTTYDYGPMDEDDTFTAPQWSETSMNLPNDAYTASFDLDQDFSNPDFSGEWSQ